MVAQRLIRLIVLALVALAWAAPAAAQQHYLWEVASPSNRIFLYGTVHAGKKEWYPLQREVEDAFAESRVLVVEADILDGSKMTASGKAMTYDPPDQLADHVPGIDYQRFLKLLPRYKIPELAVMQMKPFIAVSLLVFGEWARAGYLPEFSVDAYLIRKARMQSKPVVELEGVAAQAKLIESLTDAENRLVFEGTISALENGLTVQQIEGMVDAWQKGDPARILEVAKKYNEEVAGAAEFEEKFVWSRHAAMLEKIRGYLDSRECHFVAVGALHLAGPRGLVEQLRGMGYVVKQK